MRKNKYYIIPLILMIFIGFTSCNDTYEFHEKYIADGETVYTNKVDSLVVLGGDNRVQIEGYISNAFNVVKIDVLWNKGESSQSFDYEKSSEDIDKLELLVENLEEKSYEFQVVSIDSDGNTSLKVVTFGTSYGEIFKSNLQPRGINYFSLGADGNATVYLKPAFDVTRSTEMKYTNLSGVEEVITVSKEESMLVLTQLDVAQSIMYRTFYVPTPADEDGTETSIDEFDSEWVDYIVPSELTVILDSFMFNPVLGGVETNWENPDNLELDIEFLNIVAGEDVMNNITTMESIGTYTIAAMEAGEQEIVITVTNVYGNSWARSYTVTPKPAVLLDNSAWTVIDFSSEEPTEANWGPPIQGSAIAMIDGDVDTFWHTAWNDSQPDFPHHVTIDLGTNKTIASFEMFRRRGNWWGASMHEFWVSTDNTNWTKVATYEDYLGTDAGVVVSVTTIPVARYVKYVTTDGYSNYTYLADLNIYGLE